MAGHIKYALTSPRLPAFRKQPCTCNHLSDKDPGEEVNLKIAFLVAFKIAFITTFFPIVWTPVLFLRRKKLSAKFLALDVFFSSVRCLRGGVTHVWFILLGGESNRNKCFPSLNKTAKPKPWTRGGGWPGAFLHPLRGSSNARAIIIQAWFLTDSYSIG